MAELMFVRVAETLLPFDAEAVNYCANLAEGEAVTLVPKPTDVGSRAMLNTWRSWMRETARWMVARGAWMPLCYTPEGLPWGRRGFSEADAHELFTSVYLGTDAAGHRYRWVITGKLEPGEISASREQRLHAMAQHEAWCVERGVKIIIPESSDYARARSREDN